jgi:hypothetical protein
MKLPALYRHSRQLFLSERMPQGELLLASKRNNCGLFCPPISPSKHTREWCYLTVCNGASGRAMLISRRMMLKAISCQTRAVLFTDQWISMPSLDLLQETTKAVLLSTPRTMSHERSLDTLRRAAFPLPPISPKCFLAATLQVCPLYGTPLKHSCIEEGPQVGVCSLVRRLQRRSHLGRERHCCNYILG